MTLISKIYQKIVNTIDNPITVGLSMSLLAIPIYFYFLLPFLTQVNISSNDYGNVQQFIEWFGVPYGLLLALVLVNVWTQYDITDRAFDREIDAVFSLYNTFLLIGDKKLEKRAVTLIRSYINHVIGNYTEEYQISHNDSKDKGDRLLNDLRKLIAGLIDNNKNQVITTELLKLVNELIDDRGDRLSFSRTRMPKPVLALSIISSVLWLAPFFVLKFENFLVGSFFLSGVTFVVVSILLIVYDLDYPFTGTWIIELDTWDEIQKKI